MAIFSRLLSRKTEPPERRSWPDQQIVEALLGSQTAGAGVSVTPESSLRYAAVLACVRVLAEGVAQLPLILYERQGRGRRKAEEHPLYDLLHVAPNSAMTSFEWREISMAHLALWGNAYAEIERNGAGRPVGIWPLMPWAMAVHVRKNGERWYEYKVNVTDPVVLRQDQVLHVPGFGYDGIEGKSLIRLAREAVGLGIAAEQYGSAFFSNGARPSVVLEHPGVLSDEAYEKLKNSWRAEHEGLSNAQRMAILEEGMKLQTFGVPPEDAQFLETRRYQRTEIAAIYRVPPHMIGDLERATFSNIEQQSLDFVIHTLQPWLVRIEQRLSTLLSEAERQRYYAKHLVAGLLRGDMASRYQSYSTGRQWGWLSANDVRELEDLNPVDDGDIYLQPLNMVPAGYLPPEPEPEPPAEEAPAEEEPEENQARRRIERRAAAGSRLKLASAYAPTFTHVAQRVVNREVNDIRNAAKRNQPGSTNFAGWFQRFLDEHTAVVNDYLGPSMRTYGALITAEVEREVGREADPDGLERFTAGYISSRSDVWMARLRRGVERAIDEEGVEPADSVDAYLTQRQNEQADRWSREEVVRMGGAVARTAYGLAGVTTLMWVAAGSETCEYCQALDGQTISITANFLPEGAALPGAGGENLTTDSDIGHPPLHEACQCQILAA